jgi:hypothetical protein
MKRLILSILVSSVLLSVACSMPATLESTPEATVYTTITSPVIPTPTTPASEPFNITEAWIGNWSQSDGGEEGTLFATIIQSSGSLIGNMTFASTTFNYIQNSIISGTVVGRNVVLGISIRGNREGEIVTIEFEGLISADGNQMSGTYSMSTGYTGIWSLIWLSAV